jgi:hypothetical protein
MIEITKTLLTFLSDSMGDLGFDKDQVSFTSMHPKDIDGTKQARVNLYLYHLREDPNIRNLDTLGNPEIRLLQSLNYHCLLTAYGNEEEFKSLVLLDNVRKLLFENPHIESKDGQIVLDILMENHNPEGFIKLWQALQTPLRPSLNCIVRKQAK